MHAILVFATTLMMIMILWLFAAAAFAVLPAFAQTTSVEARGPRLPTATACTT
jgi:hypothetical protein